tara:strand:+ start:440 stop:601 length:162 start_codon:yes stop_codon:yes gene_type:complete
MIKEIAEAIMRINPNAIMSIHIEDNQTLDDCIIIWKDGTPEISKEDIKAEMEK